MSDCVGRQNALSRLLVPTLRWDPYCITYCRQSPVLFLHVLLHCPYPFLLVPLDGEKFSRHRQSRFCRGPLYQRMLWNESQKKDYHVMTSYAFRTSGSLNVRYRIRTVALTTQWTTYCVHCAIPAFRMTILSNDEWSDAFTWFSFTHLRWISGNCHWT